MRTSYNSPLWKELGERCLACGSCTIVCPTCYCFNVVDEVDLALIDGQARAHLGFVPAGRVRDGGRRAQLPRHARERAAPSLHAQGQVSDRRLQPAGLRGLRALRAGLPGAYHTRWTHSTTLYRERSAAPTAEPDEGERRHDHAIAGEVWQSFARTCRSRRGSPTCGR